MSKYKYPLIVPLLIFSLILTSVRAYADDRDSIRQARTERLFGGAPVRTAVKLNAAVVLGAVNPAVEFRVHRNITVGLEGIGIFYPKGFGKLIDGPVVMATTFAESRYYPVESFRGFFVGPNVGFSSYTLSKGIHPMYWGKLFQRVSGRLQLYGRSYSRIRIHTDQALGYRTLCRRRLSDQCL